MKNERTKQYQSEHFPHMTTKTTSILNTKFYIYIYIYTHTHTSIFSFHFIQNGVFVFLIISIAKRKKKKKKNSKFTDYTFFFLPFLFSGQIPLMYDVLRQNYALWLCLARCKLFSECKIFSSENIFEKRKYFQVLTISFIESTAISWKRFDKTSSCMATLALF